MKTFQSLPLLALLVFFSLQACAPLQEARYSLFPAAWAPWTDGLPLQSLAHTSPSETSEIIVGQSWDDPNTFIWQGIPSERWVQGDSHPLSEVSELNLQPEGISIIALSPENHVPVWFIQDLSIEDLAVSISTPVESLYKFGALTMHVIATEETFARLTGDIAQDALFVVEFGRWTLMSTHSQALEWVVGAFTKTHPRAHHVTNKQDSGIVYTLQPWGSWLAGLLDFVHRPFITLVTSQLGNWSVEHLSAQEYTMNDEVTPQIQLKGHYQARRVEPANDPSTPSESWLAEMIHNPGFALRLHQFLPEDAAGFAIVHSPLMETTRWAPWVGHGGTNVATPLDSTLMSIAPLLEGAREEFSAETGLILFSESGLDASSEWVHLRAIENPDRIQDLFETLVDETLADREGSLYVFNRGWPVLWLGAQPALEAMIRQESTPSSISQRLWVRITDQAIIMANRPGLVRSIPTRASRNSMGAWVEETLGDNMSPVTFVAGGVFEDLNQFIGPWRRELSNSLPSSWLRQERILFIGKPSDEANRNGSSGGEILSQTWEATIELSEQQPRGWENRWIYPLPRTTLTHSPKLQDVGGSSRFEVLYSTRGGAVGMLASDGTQLLQLSTGVDTPIGEPLTFDWYGTQQEIIFQAAGRKVYAWDPNGRLLPGFPIQLEEEITTPLSLGDVDGNGLPDMLLGTGDGQVWILDGRGNPLPGWPQQVLSTQREPIHLIPGTGGLTSSVMTLNENALYVWNHEGELLPEYPIFMDAPFTGGASVNLSASSVALASLDGQVYELDIQTDGQSSPSLVLVDTLQIVTEARQGTLLPSLSSVGSYTAFTSNFGYVFVHDTQRDTLYTTKMPGDASTDGAAILLEWEEKTLVVAATQSGQALAWELPGLQPLNILPPGRIESFTFGDVEQDGDIEWVVKTPAGIQTWTLYPPTTDTVVLDTLMQ